MTTFNSKNMVLMLSEHMLPKLEYVLTKMYNRIFAIMITHVMKIITCKLQILINVMKVSGNAINFGKSIIQVHTFGSKNAKLH